MAVPDAGKLDATTFHAVKLPAVIVYVPANLTRAIIWKEKLCSQNGYSRVDYLFSELARLDFDLRQCGNPFPILKRLVRLMIGDVSWPRM